MGRKEVDSLMFIVSFMIQHRECMHDWTLKGKSHACDDGFPMRRFRSCGNCMSNTCGPVGKGWTDAAVIHGH